MNQDDIFSENSDKAILITILKQPLLLVTNEVWLVTNKPVSQLFNSKSVIKFIKKNAEYLKSLKASDIESIKKTRRSTFGIRKTMKFQKNNTILEEDRFSSDESLNSDESNEGDYSDGPINEEDGLSKKDIDSLLKKIVEKYRFEYIFDFIDILFKALLPLMINLNKVLFLHLRSYENMEKRDDISVLIEFGDSFKYFIRNCLTGDDLRRNRSQVYLLDDFEKYFLTKLDYSTSCAEWLKEEIYNEKALNLAEEFKREKRSESAAKKPVNIF